MYRKKFVPPLLKNLDRKPPVATAAEDNSSSNSEPPKKKAKVEEDTCNDDSVAPIPRGRSLKLQPATTAARRPLLSVKNSAAEASKLKDKGLPSSVATSAVSAGAEGAEGYYLVLWRKPTTKKHKSWDGDGVLSVSGGHAILQDISGKDIGRCLFNKILSPGSQVSIGSKEIEVDAILSKEDFLAGKPFFKNAKNDVSSSSLTPATFSTAKGFKTPLLSSTVLPKSNFIVPTPRHDPKSENALVMPRPNPKSIPKGKSVVDVVVDPFISQHLRPHQREGIQFLYEVVMGMKSLNGQGAILADEMGLGKTLQTIGLLWTLLKQNPVYGDQPVVKKAMIVCPVTLINNWRKEFRKWLGNERIGVFVVDDKANIRNFTTGRSYSVMVIGYEKLQKVQAELKNTTIDIVIADEGHRLKTEKNKSAQAIRALNTPRRIILSGTPLQNDLHEFYIMVDFVNPGLLESYSTFKKEFENPIVKSRQPGASKKDIEKGKARGNELARITKLFVLRRTAEILSAYLPPKTEYVVFCRPSSQQIDVYKSILESSAFNKCLGSPDASLLLITLLKKLCNAPSLLASKDKEEQSDENVKSLLSGVNPILLKSKTASSSGKLRVLERMLVALKETTNEKIALVSNYTSTLDMLQNLLSARGLTFLRLDGSTPSNKRQDLVDKFNRVDNDTAFAFLLSAKSGGAGINLIGASRLVLYDLDWNPATDAQAMARIHRDGQKHKVKIYRMLTTGCFDEKIYQRQLTKVGLADSVMDQKASASNFTQAELRDLFSLSEATVCLTHDLLGCSCEGKGYLSGGSSLSEALTPTSAGEDEDEDQDEDFKYPGLMKASEVDPDKIEQDLKNARLGADQKRGLGALMEYSHILTSRLLQESNDVDDDEEYGEISIEDELLMKVVRDGKAREVSFVFQKTG